MIDIIIPSFGRAEKLPDLIENIKDTTGPHKRTWVVEDTDTDTLNALKGETVLTGTFGSPIRAVNHAFKHTSAPYFLFANDDFEFTPDWDKKALSKMTDGVSVVAINDGDPRGETQWGTITLSRRSYVNDYGGTENKGEVFHEGYTHEYSDTEYWHRAHARGVTDIARDSLIKHIHPSFGFEADDTHLKKGDSSGRDAVLFTQRSSQWTG